MGNCGTMRTLGIRVGPRGIRVGLLGMREMRRIRVGMRGIRVGMQGIMVGMQVYKHLTGILQGFCKIIYPSLFS